MISEEDYKSKIERMEEIHRPGHKMIPQYYSMIVRFEVLEVEKDNKIQKRVVKVDQKDGTSKRYVTYANLFESIEEFYEESVKHTEKALTLKRNFSSVLQIFPFSR